MKKMEFCKFRERGVLCYDVIKHCEKCGWNPEVEEKRKKKIKERQICKTSSEST